MAGGAGHNAIIFLVGMPAAGKTYWGGKIASAYNLAFTDLDLYIERQEDAAIPALFARYGEDGFRQKEHHYLKQAISLMAQPAVIACGGGTPCFYNNMGLMKESGQVIYLQAGVDVLVHNIKNSHTVRPLFNEKPDLAACLDELLKIRAPVYGQAHYILDIKDASLVNFHKIISLCTNLH